MLIHHLNALNDNGGRIKMFADLQIADISTAGPNLKKSKTMVFPHETISCIFIRFDGKLS